MIHLLDPAVIAELVGVEDLHADEPFSPGPDLILAWARRTWPEADPADHYGFAAVVWSQFGWSDPWSVLDAPRPKDAAALQMLRQARGDLGDPDDFVETVRLDAEGQHVPPAADLPSWTRWVWSRLVQHYFELGEGGGGHRR